MAQSTSTFRTPVAISRYLLPREVTVAAVRHHPAMLIPPSTQAFAGLLVAALLTATVATGVAADVVWVLWGVLFARLAWKVANWAVSHFVVTSQRLLLVTGFLTRRVGMMPLSKVTDMSFKRSFPGRLLGYGEFIVESAGQDQALRNVAFLPYPEQLYLLVCGMLFPSAADDADDEEVHPDDLTPAGSGQDFSGDGT